MTSNHCTKGGGESARIPLPLMIAAAILTVLAACVVLVPMDGVDAEGEEPEEPVVVATMSKPDNSVGEYSDLQTALDEFYNGSEGKYTIILKTDLSGAYTIKEKKTGNKTLTVTSDPGVVVSAGFTIYAGTSNGDSKFDKVIFDSLKIKNLISNQFIYTSGGSTNHTYNITVRNCDFDFTGGGYYAFNLRQSWNVTIDGCTSKGGYGLFYASKTVTDLAIRNTTISDCSYGVFLTAPNTEITIENCKIYDAPNGIILRNQGSASVNIFGTEIEADTPLYIQKNGDKALNVSVSDSALAPTGQNGWCEVTAGTKGKVVITIEERSLEPSGITGAEYAEVHDHRPLCGSDRTCELCSTTIPMSDHEYTTDSSVLCRAHTCIHCGTPTVAVPCKYDDTIPPCKPSTCEYCGGSRELADHEPNGFPCTMTGCMKCGDRLEKTPHELATTHTCTDRPCQNGCGHVEPADTVDPVHEWDDTPACDGRECIHCGTPYPREAHTLGSTATCVDRTCSACGTVVRGDGVHDYETTGYRKVCSMCGDTVDIPVEDDDDDWYWLWLQRQAAAKAEAERLAQERAEAEERKKVAAVAVAVGAAVAMVLLLMTTPRD